MDKKDSGMSFWMVKNLIRMMIERKYFLYCSTDYCVVGMTREQYDKVFKHADGITYNKIIIDEAVNI